MAHTRISWVDYAKAISILGIIVGHFAPYFSQVIGWAHPLCELMYSFHVAAFFLLSGYTTKQGLMPAKKVRTFAQTCFVPYLVAGVLSALVCMVFTPNKSFMEWGAALIYASGAYNGELLWGYPFGATVIGAVWFLPALFFGKLISTLISKFPIVVRLAITGGLFIVGMQTAKILFLPLDIQQAMCASWWITCGMILSQIKILESNSTVSVIFTGIAATLGIYYMAALWLEVWREPMYCNSTYPNGIVDMFGTTFATVAVILAAKLIEKMPSVVRKCTDWIGRNTLPIFCWHAISIAPGIFLSDWLLSFVASGIPAIAVFFFSLAADIAFSFGMTWLSSKTPGLRTVFFPGKKAIGVAAGVQEQTKPNETSGNVQHPSLSVPNTPPVHVLQEDAEAHARASGNLYIHPPITEDGIIRAANDVSHTDKSAEEVIIAAKHAAGYAPPEHKTKRKKTNGKYLRVKVQADPSRHLEQ